MISGSGRAASSDRAVAAIDLGATSGRVIIGHLDGGGPGEAPATLRSSHVARFANDPVSTPDGLHWNLLELYRQALLGLSAAERAQRGTIASIGIDSWAVDYGLLREGRLLGVPFHYRDGRGEHGMAEVFRTMAPAELYARNGLQQIPLNTIFQLATERDFLELTDQMLLIPDLLNYWLTGVAVGERSNASTTGLLDPHTREWDLDLAEQLGVPVRILPPLIDAGTTLGQLTPDVARIVGRPIPVVSVASHDTASAVAAIPIREDDVAYVSCGTWGLVGLELKAPVLSDDARHANFTNEGGLDGTTRFLRNVMGLWLLSESQRHWQPGATAAQRSSTLQELLATAARVDGAIPVFDVNDSRFLAPGDIPSRINEWFTERGETAPGSRTEVVRSIIESLAAAFASAVSEAARIASREVSAIHIVGGGSQNELLCQALANRSGLPVLAGPVEATAMGNLLVQAQAHQWVEPGLAALRAVVARSVEPKRYSPR